MCIDYDIFHFPNVFIFTLLYLMRFISNLLPLGCMVFNLHNKIYIILYLFIHSNFNLIIVIVKINDYK